MAQHSPQIPYVSKQDFYQLQDLVIDQSSTITHLRNEILGLQERIEVLETSDDERQEKSQIKPNTLSKKEVFSAFYRQHVYKCLGMNVLTTKFRENLNEFSKRYGMDFNQKEIPDYISSTGVSKIKHSGNNYYKDINLR